MSEFESVDIDRSALHQAEASFRGGRIRDAFVKIQPHLEDQPDCGRGWELLGLIRHNWRQWEAALAALEEASIRVPLSAAAECALGDCYLAVDREAWARPLYRNVVQRKSTTVCALLSAAAGLDALNEPQTAAVACRRAVTLDPKRRSLISICRTICDDAVPRHERLKPQRSARSAWSQTISSSDWDWPATCSHGTDLPRPWSS
ncbi:MAG: hypothetical protein JWP89_1397 [Schlesneria sp.]|nr:hypothetical protein [Schlesneria sp.]